MNREEFLDQHPVLLELYRETKKLYEELDAEFRRKFDRSLPLNELMRDRWERALQLGFGEGSSIYDSVLVFGKPVVGASCWIGPFCILDGSGGLEIGSQTTIASGAHIYTHDNVKATIMPSAFEIERSPVRIGENCYIGPNSVIARGVNLGDRCVVASNSFVNKSFPSNSIIGGNPAFKIGVIELQGRELIFKYGIEK